MHYGMLLAQDHQHTDELPDHFVLAWQDESIWAYLARQLQLARHRLTGK